MTLQLPAAPVAARLARRAVGQSCPDHPRLDAVLLCVSEAVTNAVLHAASAPLLTIQLDERAITIRVRDHSAVLPVRRHYGQTAPTGRGLLILDRMTSRWGVEPAIDGKVVWFEVDR